MKNITYFKTIIIVFVVPCNVPYAFLMNFCVLSDMSNESKKKTVPFHIQTSDAYVETAYAYMTYNIQHIQNYLKENVVNKRKY